MAKILKFPDKKQAPAIKPEFENRLEKIRESMARIDKLFAELRKLSQEGKNNVNSSKR